LIHDHTTQYNFDTFGRLMLLTLPDGEIITHQYDSGGNVEHIEGAKNGQTTAYLQSLLYDKFEQRTYVKLGNGIETKYTYRADNRRLANLDSIGAAAGHFQNLDYTYDKVGNITDLANNVAIPAPNSFGGPTSQHFGYDDLYRLSHADGNFKYSPGKARDYKLDLVYDTIHNITNKTQTDTLSSSGNKGIPQKGTSYDWAYQYTPNAQPHAPAHIGDRTFYYDANGNQTGWSNDKNGTKRTIVWDEDNRIQEISDNGSTTDFKYDDQGQRVFKIGKQGETVYVNQFFVVRNRSIVSKHVFAGTSRIATKLETGNGNTNIRSQGTAPSGQASGTSQAAAGQASAEIENKLITETEPAQSGVEEHQTTLPGNSEEGLESALANGKGNKKGIYKRLDKLGYEVDANGQIVPQDGGTTTGGSGQSPTLFLYYYHPDHLGSTGYVTDASGKLYEHIEYFPFGETWVQQSSNTQRTPYLFTGKELDEETGLYYFGARYYDPRTNVWQSADPVLEKYLPTGGKEHDSKLPGLGGIYNPPNLGLYMYGHQNPVKFYDPDGKRVYIGGHIAVSPFGNLTSPPSVHITLVVIPDRPQDFTNKSGWNTLSGDKIFATIGAQPGGKAGLDAGPLGNLKTEFNYSGDQPSHLGFMQAVPTPKGMTDTEFISKLINSASSYKNDKNYDVFPSASSNAYNSNSYVSGVLKAAGATPPPLRTGGTFQAPGYDKPLPLPGGSGGASGSWQNGASGSW
jgi:RHS repeat-associated protein